MRGIRTNTNGLNTNTLYNIVITFDGAINTNDGLDRVNFYVNGISQAKTIALTIGSLSNIFPNGASRIGIGAQIGQKVSNTPRALLDGNIYNTLVYNRVLSPAEVLQNYNATKSRFGL